MQKPLIMENGIQSFYRTVLNLYTIVVYKLSYVYVTHMAITFVKESRNLGRVSMIINCPFRMTF